VIRLSRPVVGAVRVHLKNTAVRRLFQVMMFVQPLMVALLTYYVYDTDDVSKRFFVVIGSGLAGMWVAAAFSSAGDLERERAYGTIQQVILSPAPLWVISAARALGALILSVVPVAVSLVFTVAVLRLELPPAASYLGILLGVAAFGAGCHAFGLLLSHLFLLSRRTAVLQNFLEWPLLVASGVAFPVSLLPTAFQWLAGILPMRWAAEAAARSYSTGEVRWSLLALAVLLAAGYFGLAVALSGAVERRVRATASLEVV
jgi:ABC-2 type transport system permease protein